MSETPTATAAPAVDNSARDNAQRVIDSGYRYMDSNLEYMRSLKRFARNNNIAENSAEFRALDTYFRSVSDTEITPLPNELQRFAALDNFDQIRSSARSLTTKRNEFSAALQQQGGAYATNAAAITRNVDTVLAANQGDDPHLILNTAINNSLGGTAAQTLRSVGWPEGVENSYNAGRDLVGKLRDIRNGAGSIWDSFTSGVGNLFNGGGSNSNGGVNFNLGGILGGLGGGIGGFMIGKLFGGGIFGTIASIFLGVFGAYLGASTFGRGGSNNSAGQGTVTGTGDASASPTGVAATSGERNIPMRAADGSVRYVSASEHDALLNSAAGFSGDVRFNPSRGEEPCPPTYRGGRQSERFQPAYSY